MKTHKDLNVWKCSIDLVINIYSVTRDFPKEEIFGLTAQIKRAVVSVPSNISEGAARDKKKEFIRFLQISMGSLAEVETQLIIAGRLHYLDKQNFEDLLGSINKIRAQISGLIRSLKIDIEKIP